MSMVCMYVAHFTVCDNFLDHVPLKYTFEKNLFFLWRSKEDSEDYFFDFDDGELDSMFSKRLESLHKECQERGNLVWPVAIAIRFND